MYFVLKTWEDDVQVQATICEDAWLLPVRDACRVSGLSHSHLYLALAAGTIRHRKLGRRTLIVRDSLRAFVDALPDATLNASGALGPRRSHASNAKAA